MRNYCKFYFLFLTYLLFTLFWLMSFFGFVFLLTFFDLMMIFLKRKLEKLIKIRKMILFLLFHVSDKSYVFNENYDNLGLSGEK